MKGFVGDVAHIGFSVAVAGGTVGLGWAIVTVSTFTTGLLNARFWGVRREYSVNVFGFKSITDFWR